MSRTTKILSITGGSIALAGVCVVLFYIIYQTSYSAKLYPGVKMASQTDPAAITAYAELIAKNGLSFTYQEYNFTLEQAVTIDPAETIAAGQAIGRQGDSLQNLLAQLKAAVFGTNIPLVYTLDRQAMLEQLSAEFDDAATPYQNATLTLADDKTLTVVDNIDGTSFNWDAVLAEVEQNLNTLQPVAVTLQLSSAPAPITTADAKAKLTDVQSLIDLAPLTLTYEDGTYTIETDALATWFTLEPNNGAIKIILNPEAVRTTLAPIAGEIDIPVKEGKFSLDEVAGTVQLTQFEDGADGLGVNMEKTVAALQTDFLNKKLTTIPLVVEVTHPRVTPDNLNDLGVKELLGTGTTNFGNSPYNRVLNIRKGADILNGLLIAPGETFSLLDALKPIDVEHGWYSELVIKGDKLEKEAGGGLCQVGSTSFRAVMLSGLPIVERRNHSWAISYYAYKGLAGVDATIYDPSPDFRFLNDTGHYILWRSRIEGSNIYFEFWGTSDGRKGYFTDPTNYNHSSPGPTIETVDNSLPPGTRTCDGHSFSGVTASFDYIIEQPDGTTDKQTFTSVYKSRPEMCIVGPDAPAETTPTNTNTNSTITNTNTNTSNTNTVTNKNTNKNGNNKNSNKNTNS